VVTDLKIVDVGFYQVLDRPAHLVIDGPLVGSGLDYLAETAGHTVAVAVAIGAVLLAVGVIALAGGCAARLSRVLRGHRTLAIRPLAVLGAQLVAGQPVAARTAVGAVYDQVAQVRHDLHDRAAFAQLLVPDRFHDTSGDQLLAGLRGKDVVFAFVESYGRTAVESPTLSPAIDAVLDAGSRDLRAAGFSARSGFLTSPTFGGGSWLAHSTLLSGAWINSPARYSELLASRRTTLVADFNRAGWRTVADMPGTTQDWPEGSFYTYQKLYAAYNLGYNGPRFDWSPMPDQFALQQLQQRELAPPRRRPVMATVELTSSHSPWAPLPTPVAWNAVGDGSVFDPMPAAGLQPGDVWKDQRRVRTEYSRSIQYSLTTVISFLATYGTADTVLVVLGDHQPAPIITGAGASRDVPMAIVARDPAVLSRVSSWGWTDGLHPRPDAPVWTMDSFRDRFLAAFSTGGR
jgi:hypothetical protein